MTDPQPTPRRSLDLTRPFTRAEFVASGRSASTLRRRDYLRLLPGVWARCSSLDDDSMIRAALKLHPPGAFASHLSAAAVLGLPVPEHRFAHVTVSDPRDRRFHPQVKAHVTGRRRRIVEVQGIRTTDPVATFIDCAGWLTLVDLVVLGDAVVRQFQVTPTELLRETGRSTDYYAKAAHAAAGYVRCGAGSPMESRSRMLLVLGGLPEPEVQVAFRGEHGEVLRTYDMYYRLARLAVEYDGRHHASDVRQWRRDLARREDIDDDGDRILVLTAEDIFRQPSATLLRVHRMLELRGWPSLAPINDGWRDHFAA